MSLGELLGKTLGEMNEVPREELYLWNAYFDLKEEERQNQSDG